MKQFYVYILSNKKNGVLYIGFANDLTRRIYEHKQKTTAGFSKKYGLDKLVYYEVFDDYEQALLRERQMKKWNREWKINRIHENNPDWHDLYDSLNI